MKAQLAHASARDAAELAETVASVARSCRMLRALTQLQADRLTDIAQATGLETATVLRLLSEALPREGIAEAAASGHAVLLDVGVERVGGIGMPLMGPGGRPVAALSEQIIERRAELATALRREAAVCEALLRPKAAAGVREEATA